MATVTFKRVTAAKRGTTSYQSPDANGTVYLSKNAFNGAHPETLVIEDVPTPVSGTKLEPEAAKAARKAKAAVKFAALKAELEGLTPAQRAQKIADRKKAEFDRATAKAAKIAEEAAKL